ncbi:MAG: pilus assembly protein PilM [Candidatus Yonathbacteria bacterium]|nr:pilus assembly protein PilM [Candidatus Yonathbacteria bacterium]
MNLLNLLTKEKRVAGIEISDSVVRIAFLRARRDKPTRKTIEELVLIEEPIAADIIVEGVVANRALLGKTLKNIWNKANLDTDYAIVSIPDDKIYSRVFSFPRIIEGDRLAEAMRLAIGFQLPVKTEDAYLDWERLGSMPPANEILLATIPRVVAQGYVEALDTAGIKTLALESHLGSIARAIKLEHNRTMLFTKKTPDGATVFALRNGALRFSRTLPARFIDESKIPAEVHKIKTALEGELKEEVIEASILDAEIRDDYANKSGLSEPKAKWIIALGAMIRGQIPEGEDNLVSLLPIGTEEAYAYQKATAFIALVRNMTVGVSIFFVATFLAAYLFVFSLSQDANKTIATLSVTSTSPEILAKEAWVNKVNALTETGQTILAQTPLWSAVVDEINARIIDGISISTFGASSIAGNMSLVGTAKDRATLNKFKKSLQSSPMLAGIEIPLTNLEQREEIPFNASFRLKDPSAVFYK